MYKINRIGPWPHIDIGAGTEVITTGMAETNTASALRPWLNTANLGSKSEASVNGLMSVTHNFTAGYNLSFGVCLQPLSNVIDSKSPVYLDLCISTYGYQGAEITVFAFPWVGFIDGGSPVAGWNVANDVSYAHVLPCQHESVNTMITNTQVLLKDIISGSDSWRDGIIACGFTIQASSATGVDNLFFNIGARYATKSEPAIWTES